MKHKATILAATAAIWLAGVGVGATQEPRPPAAVPGSLPSYEILTIVRSLGLDPIGRPLRQGPTYVLRAVDEYNRELRVVVDARSGRVRSAVPVVSASNWRERPGFGDEIRSVPRSRSYNRNAPNWSRTLDDDDEIAPRPPSAVPRVIRAPRDVDRDVTRSAAVTSAHPPVPRPRPGTPVSASVESGDTAPADNPHSPAVASDTPAGKPEIPAANQDTPAKKPEMPVNPLW